jgi:ribonuclease P protein component
VRRSETNEGYHNETNLSTPQHPPQAHPRLPHPYEDQERPQSHQRPPGQRQKKIGRIKHFHTLTGQREFDRVYKRADKVWHTPWFVLFFKKGPEAQVAFVAGKKVGNAVRRNRAKRLLRALFIETLPRLGTGTYILVAKPPILEADFATLRSGWHKALDRSRAWARRPEKP